MRLLIGLGFVGLAIWGVSRYRANLREARLREWWLEQQAKAAE